MSQFRQFFLLLASGLILWGCDTHSKRINEPDSDSLIPEGRAWVSSVLNDSAYLESLLAQRKDIQANDLRTWLRAEAHSQSTDTLLKVLFALEDLGAESRDLFVREPLFLDMLALALQDTSSSIRKQVIESLLRNYTRQDLASVDSLIKKCKCSDEDKNRFDILLHGNGEVEDTTGLAALIRESFPDSMGYSDSVRLTEAPASMPFQDALYYHYAKGLQRFWAFEIPSLLEALNRILQRDWQIRSGYVEEHLSWKILYHYSRLHESELQLCRGMAMIEKAKTENAIKKMGMTPKEFWHFSDSLISRDWGFGLATPIDSQPVYFIRNFYLDPDGDTPGSIFLEN